MMMDGRVVLTTVGYSPQLSLVVFPNGQGHVYQQFAPCGECHLFLSGPTE